MNLTVTFLTPIEVITSLFSPCFAEDAQPFKPQDWVRQSMPFSYLTLEASSTDGSSHDVQVYSDISAGQCSPAFPSTSLNAGCVCLVQNGFPETAA